MQRLYPWVYVTGCLCALLAIAGMTLPTTSRAAEALSAEQVIARADERFRTLQDYECLMDSSSRAGRKTESGTYRIWYKNPGMLRLQVVKGSNKGSVLAIDRNGRIRGRQGGLLKPFVVTLSPNDSRIKGVRGSSVTELPWGEYYRKFRERAAQPGARMSMNAWNANEGTCQVTLTYIEGGIPMREVYHIDTKLWIPLESEVYEGETLVDHAIFREIKLNTGLAENWFRM